MVEQNAQLLDEMFRNKVKAKGGKVIKDEIICIVDRSGSMSSIREDAQGGLNTFISDQKRVEGDGANLTLVEFDDAIDTICNRVDLNSVPEYKLNPRGGTALLDAIGKTVNSLPDMVDAKVILVVVTDGGENASTEYTREQVNKLIDEKKALGWEVLFLAANQDAITVGTSFGFDASKCVNFSGTGIGTKALYAFTTDTVKSYRSAGSKQEYETTLTNLKAKLDKDSQVK